MVVITQEDKELLLKDLCARQPYSVFLYHEKYEEENTVWKLDTKADVTLLIEDGWLPYLRPMSSMTEEEKEELHKLHFSIKYEDWLNKHAKLINYTYEDPIIRGYPNQKDFIAHDINEITCANLIDWLNAHHFDYRGLIPKGLALEAPEGMYNLNEK